MTVFLRKTVPLGYSGKLKDQFGLLQMTMGVPHDLMLMSTGSADNKTETIYIGLPDTTLLLHFDGFERIKQSDLPNDLTALVLRHDGFARKFPDIAKKIRAKI